MEDSKKKSFTGQVQLLLKTDEDFPQKLCDRLVLESNNVTNHFELIIRLFNEEVLCDGLNDSEASMGLKEMMVQLAFMIGCLKGAGAVDGMMNALAESGNSQIISCIQTWLNADIPMETGSDLNEPKQDSTAAMTTTDKLPKEMANKNLLSAYGTKLIDMIMTSVEDDLMERLESYLIGKASQILNGHEFSSNLVHQKVLDEADVQLTTELTAEEGQRTEKAIKAACSQKTIGSLVLALQSSNNERILAETCEWLETSSARNSNYPIAVKSPANKRSREDTEHLRSTILEQAPLSDGISKLATYQYQQKLATQGISQVQFDKERMIACCADGTLNLWNWQGAAEEPINIAVNVKSITCFEYDEQLLMLGTAEGAVHLFDARTFEEKSAVNLKDPVMLLQFVENTLVVITQIADQKKIWWIGISRPYMQLRKPRSVISYLGSKNQIPRVSMYGDTSIVYQSDWGDVYDTKSGYVIRDDRGLPCSLSSPADISTLNVGDLIYTKRVFVAGCIDGTIVMWNTSKLMSQQKPTKTFQAHSEPIVSLGFLNGHLLSLDQSGRLLMWSGFDLENQNGIPAGRVLIDNSNVTYLVAHERWFASCSSKDDVIDIWTVPDSWLRTG